MDSMKVDYKKISDTQAELIIEAGEEKLKQLKSITLKRLQPEVSAPGFRKGKVPLNLVEQHADEDFFKSQFMDDALTALYRQALTEKKLRPLTQPKVEIQKFVPFSDIAFKITVDVVPPVKLGDYKKVSKKIKDVQVTKKDIEEVIENLRKRMADKQPSKEAVEMGDEVITDFSGVDDKGKEVAGASGKDYPIVIGSNTFIDGFEEQLVGMKPNEEKTFTLKFPKDYAHKPLASKKVVFTVNAKTINHVILPVIDDDFAKKIGPFKTVNELETDIEKQLTSQKQQEAANLLKDEVIEELVKKSSLTIPDVLVQENITALLADFKQNLVYRGITFDEYLKQAGKTEAEYKEEDLRPQAEMRVKTGLVLAETAEVEKIKVSPEDIEIRMQLLKGQHKNDEQMLKQLSSKDAESEIASRLMTEKTIEKLVEYATN